MSSVDIFCPIVALLMRCVSECNPFTSIDGAEEWLNFCNWIQTAQSIAGDQFGGSNSAQALKLSGAAAALLALMPNVRALIRTQTFLVSCIVPMNLTGRQLGDRKPYEGPIRRSMFIFSLFIFYQIFSQASGLLVPATAETLMLDFSFQLLLLIWLLLSLLRIDWTIKENFTGDERRMGRMRQELDKALATSGIRLNAVFWTGVVMPLFALLPKAFEVTGVQSLREIFQLLPY